MRRSREAKSSGRGTGRDAERCAAETSGIENTDEILGEEQLVDANREMWAILRANYSRRTLVRINRGQRECMYPKPAKDVGQVRLAIMQWEEKWTAMMSELGGSSKIIDLWRMSALLEICTKDVKEQMLMRLDEIGENCENLKAKVVSYTTNKAEQARGGQKETAVPMELDNVSGSELYDDVWDDVDEVRGDERCHNCGMMGHFAKDCSTRGEGKGKGRDEGKEQVKR